jgi:quercetin dioxygenase-like cupin family protein
MEITFSRACLAPGAGHSWHTHEKEDEAVFVLQGNGTMSFEGREVNYGPGTAIVIPRGTKHQNINTSKNDVVLVSMFNPPIR